MAKKANIAKNAAGKKSAPKNGKPKKTLPRKSSGRKKVLVTSALPYVNNIPHLGNLIGSVISADAFARFKRLEGNEVLFVLGTDEHGTTTEAKAMEEGITPKELVDKYFKIHKEIYDWFQASYDCMGRTSSKENAEITKHIFTKLYQNGYIIERKIMQLYSEKLKKFLSDRFVEGECPFCHSKNARGDQCEACGRLLDQKDLIDPVSKLDSSKPVMKESRHLFIDLPKMRPALVKWIEGTQDKWSQVAKNVTEQWLKQGLRERCITRDLEWGIPVPLKGWEGKVFYSWFDAPIGYIGITTECIGEKWKQWWMNENVSLYQFMGKDNVPFHSILFPAFLIGTGEEFKLVDCISATDYLNYEDKKFSKSKGTGVFGDDAMSSGIKSDIWRYYLLRMRPETSDTEFEWNDFMLKTNNELIGNFGNLANRVLTLNQKFFDSEKQKKNSNDLQEKTLPMIEEYRDLMNKTLLREALLKANEISAIGNKHIQGNEPWIKIKTDKSAAGSAIAECIDLIKILAVLYHPFVPSASGELWAMLGEKKSILETGLSGAAEEIPAGRKINAGKILFEKLEEKKILEMKKRFSKE